MRTHRSTIDPVNDVPADMPNPDRRPFYTEFAWAFDLLIDRPVAKECDAISERHTLDDGCGERSCDYAFVMRCWTPDELDSYLRASGFTSVEWFGAYSPEVAPGSTDRLVAVGQL